MKRHPLGDGYYLTVRVAPEFEDAPAGFCDLFEIWDSAGRKVFESISPSRMEHWQREHLVRVVYSGWQLPDSD